MQLEDIHENLCSLGEASKSGEAMSSSKSGYFGVEKLDDIWILAVIKKIAKNLYVSRILYVTDLCYISGMKYDN